MVHVREIVFRMLIARLASRAFIARPSRKFPAAPALAWKMTTIAPIVRTIGSFTFSKGNKSTDSAKVIAMLIKNVLGI